MKNKIILSFSLILTLCMLGGCCNYKIEPRAKTEKATFNHNSNTLAGPLMLPKGKAKTFSSSRFHGDGEQDRYGSSAYTVMMNNFIGKWTKSAERKYVREGEKAFTPECLELLTKWIKTH